ncbi:MAG: porphobilinogen synthase [Planctomycetota bacterium]
MSGFPAVRMRRLRRSPAIRALVRETDPFPPARLVLPAFVTGEKAGRRPIKSLPGFDRLSRKAFVEEAKEADRLGIGAMLLFGIPDRKDAEGSCAWANDGPVPSAIRAMKEAGVKTLAIADICLCEYTDHGHCGLVEGDRVANDSTLRLLSRAAVACAKAGADLVAPSDMMDGRVRAIRTALDAAGFAETGILAYAAKYASAFYGPFRDAAGSAPAFGDRLGYQMNPANVREAMREMALDLDEGADILMVKPALAYLDVLRAARERFDVPLAAYSVSGEYAMVKAAAKAGFLDERAAAREILTSIRRAGADIAITYWAKEAARGFGGR